jgi:hypothetical protein
MPDMIFAGRRVWIAIGISLVLHLFVASLHGIRDHQPVLVSPDPVALHWVQLPAPSPVNPPRTQLLPALSRVQAPALTPATHAYEVLAMPETMAPVPAVSVPESAVAPPMAPRVDLASVFAQARTLAKAGTPATGTADQPAWLEKPRAPQIEHALKRQSPGEYPLSNGLIRVVSASGQSYCLQPPPDFARGGPVEPTSVPTTCP